MVKMDQLHSKKRSDSERLRPRVDSRKAYKRLLIVSLFINLLGFVGGGFYVYKTGYIVKGWYDKYIKVVPNKKEDKRDMRYHRQKLHAFRLFKEDAKDKKAIIFVGDSLTDTFEWHEYFSDLEGSIVLNRGIAGDTIDDLIHRFDVTFSSEYDSQKVFIMIGINDMVEEDFRIDIFVKKYKVLLEKLLVFLPPERICIQSILPVRRENISNMTVKRVNESLRSNSDEKGLCYVDLYEKLADSKGQLDEKYSLDGIHLTSEGYRVWLETIESYLVN